VSSLGDTIIGIKGEDWGGGGRQLMGQPHLERLKKVGKWAKIQTF